MDIYIKINSATQGPFTIEQVRQMLAAGQVTLTHQAFIDGQTSWIQLSQIPGLQNTYSFSSSNPEPPKKILQTYKQTPQKPMSNLIEYRRTCQVCGKIWHSLVSREKQIISSQKSNSLLACGGAMQSCGTCGTIGSGTQAQGSRNLDANQSELQRLKSCPQCSSANYKEEVIDHANQLR